jgi:ATP-dependent RNA helicase RhlE
VETANTPSPVHFSEFGLSPSLLKALTEMGLEKPTEIQSQGIPQIMAGHDIFGIAPTGTGKTAAYLLPLLHKLKYAQGDAPRALILAPTRELVTQITGEIERLTAFVDLRAVELYGGLGPKTQIEMIQKGCDILVATPGRFMDIYLKGEIIVKQLKTLILDEADKMMDMGFMPQIRRILEVIPSKKRQNLLFSATLPPKVEQLSEEFLEFPVKIEVQPQATPAETVSQLLYETPNLKTKINLLFHFLQQEQNIERVIIFTKTRKNADAVYHFLERKKLGEIRVIHANKGQNTRLNAIEAFKAGGIRILVATDVMARGIDVQDVSHVINFDVPLIYEDYVHRIGRTGRALKSGASITFADPAEMYHIGKIESLIRQAIPRASIPDQVEIPPTPREEKQTQDRAIDAQKRKENPEFKGAFHDKKERRHYGKNRKPKKR